MIRMRVAITGVRGLIGGALATSLRADGHEVVGISRRREPVGALGADDETAERAVAWDVAAGKIDASALEGLDAIVHLAGESIGGRWTATRKAAIMSSRVDSTRLLAGAIRELDAKPSVFVCGSAVGFYGNRGEDELTERSLPGDGFLADVCMRWERAAVPIPDAGVRLVRIRTGLVVGPGAEAISRMAKITRLGAGGPLGGGRQWWSWISLDDEVRAIRHLIDSDANGAFNLTSPNPVRQRDFQQALSAALRRPSFMPAPKLALRAALGEMGQGLLLDSTRVLPDALSEDGFEFSHPQLADALADAV
ncbi:TIGR01777 family oxidoreductase [Candidatus Poriferisodalis sp.]|uniref:TIGR01777 family oxidoreductase n=1 Tax=Candidatus Poriferisodalis sp. TaxID=3101277 RepID=UPI003B029BEE